MHESGCFLIPNPWDVGIASYLQGLGFKALATTSSGFGWSNGKPLHDLDTAVDRIRAARRAIDKAGGDTLLVGRAECTMQDISPLGVRRVSVGGALARTGWDAFMRAARSMAEEGKFDGLADAASSDELDSFFRDDLPKRGLLDA